MADAHRPTTLALYLDHCPRAVDHYEHGTPQDREVFAVGTAAHEVLHAIAEGRDVDALTAALITSGRGGDDAEGPLHPDAVYEGRDLARAFLDVYPPDDGALYEQWFAFDRDWLPVDPRDPEVWFRTRIDVVHRRHEEDEDGYAAEDCVITDYKTAWPADERELDTLQRRAQAVCAWLRWGDEVGSITIRVSNLRRRQQFDRTIPLDEDGIALLTQWQADLDAVCRAAEVKGPDGLRPARPGTRCGGCPYVASCEPARAVLDSWADADLDDVARRFVVAKSTADGLGKVVRARTADSVLVVDDVEVGALPQPHRTAGPEVVHGALLMWLQERAGVAVDESTANALLGWWVALGEPSTGLLEAIAKALYPTRQEAKARRAWLESVVTTTLRPRFGVRRVEKPGEPVQSQEYRQSEVSDG